jgi:Ni/Fe-hydrogenase subunit HybB-like protein
MATHMRDQVSWAFYIGNFTFLVGVAAAAIILIIPAYVYDWKPIKEVAIMGEILAPRFLASAMCSGPAILLILFQLLRRTTRFEIKDEALWKIAEIMAYAMFINLFLLGAEAFKEMYSNSEQVLHFNYLFAGIGNHQALVPYGRSVHRTNTA